MNSLSSLRVGARLGIGFGMLLLLMTALAAIGLSRMSLLQNNLDRLVHQDFAQVAEVNAMRDAVQRQSVALRDIILQQDVSFLKTELKFMKAARARYQTSAAALGKLVTTPQDKTLLEQLGKSEDKIQGFMGQSVDFSISNDPENAAKVMREQIRPRQTKLLAQLNGMLDRLQKEAGVSVQRAARAYHSAVILTVVLWIAAMVLGIGIAYVISRGITLPLRRAVETAGRIAQGDLSMDIEAKGKDELATLLLALKNMNTHLRETIGGVSRAAADVAASSAGLSEEAGQVGARAELQTERIMQISGATEQVTVSIAEVAAGAARVAEASAKTKDIAAGGNENMDKEVESSQRIVSSVETSATTIEELSSAIQRIGEVTRVIKDIAEQTNLLALNAAIEAARAGEQGRGFAVVADEVRKLAERTASSTSDISQVVETIHDKTTQAVEAMHQVRQEVQDESGLTLKTSGILREIAVAAEEVNRLAREIASATTEQKTASTETAIGMEKISSLTEENTASIHQVGNAADGLAATAAELQRLVGRFKLAG